MIKVGDLVLRRYGGTYSHRMKGIILEIIHDDASEYEIRYRIAWIDPTWRIHSTWGRHEFTVLNRCMDNG